MILCKLVYEDYLMSVQSGKETRIIEQSFEYLTQWREPTTKFIAWSIISVAFAGEMSFQVVFYQQLDKNLV